MPSGYASASPRCPSLWVTTMLKLVTLGGLTVRGDNAPLDTSGIRKPLVLLTVVAAGGAAGVSRDRLQALFWPESDTERSRGGLKQAQYLVRQALGVDPFVAQGSNVALDAKVLVADISEFQDRHKAGAWEHAVALYGGPFLDGVYLKDVPDFEQWVDVERARLAALYARALERLAAEAAEHHDLAGAADWWRRRAELDRLDGRVARQYMEALVAAGERDAAIRHARVHGELVRAELGAEPDAELLTFAERLRTTPPATTATPGNGVVEATAPQAAEGLPSASAPSPRTEFSANPLPERARDLTRPWRGGRPGRWALLGAAAAVVFLSTVVFERLNRSPRPKGLDRARVLVTAFTNRSGDSTLDFVGAMAADWITQGLSESEVVNVVDAQTAFQASRSPIVEAGGSDTDRLRILSQRAAAGTVVSGAYYLSHDSVVFESRITDARDGTVLRTLSPITGAKTDPMPAVALLRERTVGAFATIVEPRLASLSGRSTQPPTIEAYRAYLRGLELFTENHPAQALPLFLDAARRDSTFALPLVWASLAAFNSHQESLEVSLVGKLASRRARLAPIDRYALEYLQLVIANKSREERLAVLQHLSALAPASNWSVMEARLLKARGQERGALAALLRIDPEHGWAGAWSPYWNMLADSYHDLGEYRLELETARRAERFAMNAMSDSTLPAWYRFKQMRPLIALGRIDEATALIRQVGSQLSATKAAELLTEAAEESRAHGHPATADSLFRRALELHRSPESRADPRDLPDYADCAIEAGSLEEALRAARAMLADSSAFSSVSDRLRAHGVVGMVAADRGDRPGAEAELRAIERLKPPHHQWSEGWMFQMEIAGFLHDRQLVLQYYGDWVASETPRLTLRSLFHDPRAFRWLANDPAVERP